MGDSDPMSPPQVFHRQAYLSKADPELRLFYMECSPPTKQRKGTILLIHGFPESSYQFRHVLVPFAEAGYHVIAPDYKGHGFSSKPFGDYNYTKKQLAAELFELLAKHIGVKEKVHVVGHDIGGTIAHAYAAQFPENTADVIWGECPLPGSTLFDKIKHTETLWHFDFQSHKPELSAALVAGKEKMYLKHFYDRLTQNASVFSEDVLDFYTTRYSMPDALRCAFLSYRAFTQDGKDNLDWLNQNGKSKVRSMIMSGDHSFIAAEAEGMAREMYETVHHATVEDSGHFLAEENPTDFVRKVLQFVQAKSP
ncbi:Soluble epoxide hydrolase [Cyphellophora attinorum]|uniref:Soluble epoxide hydrolase n=1 Tax=Cyphellophora attinorum TaxID=1664694 RepID=A0A0N1H9G6_9EURO|nr:Soluble epoxide hydrolase [Phialophora attinorum]KPI40234.1 Soluble epoxide hydrolase [Phialophora attinorum]